MNIGKESEYVEFKKSTSETNEAVISIGSMLNKHGRGTVYFGVRNDGEVVGQDIGKNTLNQLSQKVSGNILPLFNYEINQRNTPDGLSFIEVSFSGNRTPYSSAGRYYIRFHDEDRQMDNETLRNYYLNQRQDYSSWEKSDSGCPLSDVNEKQLEEYWKRGQEKGRITGSYTTSEKALGKLGLLYSDHLNNAGNVLFSSRKPLILKLARFASETKLTILALNQYQGNVYECMEQAMKFYSENINWNISFDGNIRRIEQPEIPMEAVREIVVNAFSHGDYAGRTDFELSIFSDRVSIYSPGHFPSPYTPEEFAENALESIPMNPTISNVLYRDGTIEEITTGFERTFVACKKAHIDYKYENLPDGFRFTFYRKGYHHNKKKSKEDSVLLLMKNDPEITVRKISDQTGFSTSTVNRLIRKAKEDGSLVREGDNIYGRWKVE